MTTGTIAPTPERLVRLPARTSFRLALLAIAVLSSGEFVYQGIYLTTPPGARWYSLFVACLAAGGRESPVPPGTPIPLSTQHATACLSASGRQEVPYILLALAGLVVLTVALWLTQPAWLRWRRGLEPLSGPAVASLVDRLEELRAVAGVGPVAWYLQPRNHGVSAVAFGRPGRRAVALSGGAAVAAVRRPGEFSAVVLHELGHIKNRHIDQTYLAVAAWRAFVAGALVPMVVLALLGREFGLAGIWWRVALLALAVFLLRNWVVRAREFDADASAVQSGQANELPSVLEARALAAAAGPRPSALWERARRLARLHPSDAARVAALRDPSSLDRLRFVDGLAVGLVAALGAQSLEGIQGLANVADHVGGYLPVVPLAIVAGTAFAVSAWRAAQADGGPGPLDGGAPTGWGAGAGLGLGLALGPVLALSSVARPGLAPDSLGAWPVAVLAGWIALCVLVAACVPPWLGHWARSWQQVTSGTRAGILVACAGASVVLMTALDLLLAGFNFLGPLATGGWARHALSQVWTTLGLTIAEQSGAWIVVLVVLVVPAVGGLRALVAVPRRGDLLPDLSRVALVAIAGIMTGVTAMAAIDAVARYTLPQPVRWATEFSIRLTTYQEAVSVLVGAAFAAAAAVALRSARHAALAVLVAPVVTVVCVLAFTNTWGLGGCAGFLDVWYSRPPADSCRLLPAVGYFWSTAHPAAVEAALLAVLVVPAVFGARRWLAATRFARLVPAARTLRWAAAVAGCAVLVVGAGLWAASGSARGLRPAGSVGSDGWVRQADYELRLLPFWFELPGATTPDRLVVTFDGAATGSRAAFDILSGPDGTVQESVRAQVVAEGGTEEAIGGSPALCAQTQDAAGWHLTCFISRRGRAYAIVMTSTPLNALANEQDVADILQTWRWTTGS